MAHCLGIDLGTSAVKAVIVDERGTVVAEMTRSLEISRPRPFWSEQNPQDWWRTVCDVLDALCHDHSGAMSDVRGIGLSGQMHGAVLLDGEDRPLRPAILWNDGRAFSQCERLTQHHAALMQVTGVWPMPGFTAPKVMWVADNEPEVFSRIRTVLLPKDYIRFRLTGERVSDMSDAAGSWWLDQARRGWSAAALAATGADPGWMPRLVEGNVSSGVVRPELAARWGLSAHVLVAGGAGDAAAGAVGLGAVADGAAFLSLGTSGQLFVTTATYRASPETLVHAFCHALPNRWFQMGAMLNGASCLAWAAKLVGRDIGPLMAETEVRFNGAGDLVFLPYLTGERTPHNDPYAKGIIFGLSPGTDAIAVVQAVLEGVAFSFADAHRAISAAGTRIDTAAIIGGGAKSKLWIRILASVLNLPLTSHSGADKGPAFGAARLARMAATGERTEAVCTWPAVLDVTNPEPALVEAYAHQLARFRRLYQQLHDEFRAA